LTQRGLLEPGGLGDRTDAGAVEPQTSEETGNGPISSVSETRRGAMGVAVPIVRLNRVTPAGSSAYFARLDADLGIIDNNISEGNVIAVVDSTDWALSYTGPSRR
jgi:hypothetical protein